MRHSLSLFLLATLFLAPLTSCDNREGTISVTVVSAPQSDLLAQIEHVEATFVSPSGERSFQADRSPEEGLHIQIALEANGDNGELIVEGFAADGSRIAFGKVGPLPLGAIDASVAVYLGAPMSIAQAPVSLSGPRSHVGGSAASFGALLAGGQDENGPVDIVEVYSTYTHTTQPGLAMPSPLIAPTLAPSASGLVYMVGGTNVDAEPSNSAYAFDTTQPPTGRYRALRMAEDLARSSASAAIVGQEQFLITGNPALLLDGFQAVLRPLLGGEELDGPATTVVSQGRLLVLIAGKNVASGAAIFENGQIRRLSPPPEVLRTDHRSILLPTGEILLLGGAIDNVSTTTAVVYKPIGDVFQPIDLLATPRRNPAVAITASYLVVIGGEDDTGAPVGDAEVFDANTLQPVVVLPLEVPRTGISAHTLNNGQVLIVGGTDASGQVTDRLELFTPDQ